MSRIKIRVRRRPAAPRNPAARALRSPLYRQRVEKNSRAYSRKFKHKRGAVDPENL